MQSSFLTLALSLSFIAASLAPNALWATGKPIAALYETSYTNSDGLVVERGRWYFVRQRDRVETATGAHAEVWERYPDGQIALRRLFGEDEIAIKYSPGELAARGVATDWEALRSVIAPDAMGRLKQTEKSDHDRSVVALEGQLNGETVEVSWLPRKHIPAMIRRTSPNGIFTMRLMQAHAPPPRDWLPSSRWPVDNFRNVDAADLGDLEHDPAIQRLLREEPVGGAHAHPH